MTRAWGHVLGIAAAAAAGAGGWHAEHAWSLPRTPLDRVELLIETGAPAEAAAALDARLRGDPRDRRAWLLLGAARQALDDAAGAAAAWREIPEESPFHVDSRLRWGQGAFARHDAAAAEAAFSAALQTAREGGPDWLAAAQGLLAVWNLQERREEGGVLAKRMLPHVPPALRGQIWDELTIRRTARRDDPSRAARLREFLAGNPDDMASRAALANALADNSALDEAEALLAPRFAAGGPQPLLAWRAWLRCLHDGGQHEELFAALAAAPPEAHATAWYWRYRAAALRQRQDWPGAFAAIAEALRRDGMSPELHDEAARIASRAGQPEAAAAAAANAVRWTAALNAQRDAWQAWSKANAELAPFGAVAAAGFALAKSCEALGQADGAAYYRSQAAEFERLARAAPTK